MNLVLLLPLGLAALAAWLLPLLIHLRRRSEQHRTDFAALRWLPARARPRSRLRFEEWPLLLVRLALLAALALLLAEPVLFGGPQAKRWLVVSPDVERTAIPGEADGVERRWLATGFPLIDEAAPSHPAQPVSSLLRELDATLPADTQVSVLVPARLDGADAERPTLHRRIDWQVIEGTSADEPIATARPVPRPMLAVRHDAGHANAVRYLRAAAVAWQAASATDAANKSGTSDIAAIGQPLPAIDKPLVWLASGPIPDALRTWIEDGGTALVDAETAVPQMARQGIPLWRDEQGDVLATGMPLGRGRLLQLAHPLSPDAMPMLLDASFPDRLWALFASVPPAPARIAARDYAPATGARAWPEQPEDLQPWLLLLIAALFVVERWMASGRREVVVP